MDDGSAWNGWSRTEEIGLCAHVRARSLKYKRGIAGISGDAPFQKLHGLAPFEHLHGFQVLHRQSGDIDPA